MNKKYDEDDLAYIAGFIDGEGCLYAMPDKYCKVTISVDNFCLDTLKFMQNLFGGSIRKVKKQKPHHKQLHHWSIVGKQALNFCQVIVPYLKQKTEQALLIIAIQLTKTGKTLTQEIIDERHFFQNRLKELHNAT